MKDSWARAYTGAMLRMRPSSSVWLVMLALALSAVGLPSRVAADDADDGARPPRDVVPLSTILASARRIVIGKMIEVELELDLDPDVDSPTDPGRWIYEVEFLTPDGRIVELEYEDTIFSTPLHPYAEALIAAAPIPDPRSKRDQLVIEGDVPSPMNPPPGCHFHTRCPYAVERCRREEPPLRAVNPGHFVACHLREPGAAPVRLTPTAG